METNSRIGILFCYQNQRSLNDLLLRSVWFAYQSTTVTDFVQTANEAIGQSADIFKADLLTLKVNLNFQLFYAYFGNFPRK
jgi:hypothetical protein